MHYTVLQNPRIFPDLELVKLLTKMAQINEIQTEFEFSRQFSHLFTNKVISCQPAQKARELQNYE